MTIEILEYLDDRGRSPFGKWFDNLNRKAAAKVTTAIDRMGRGLMSNVKSVGGGVYERKIKFGPRYRVYFGSETVDRTTNIAILLRGGTKKSQGTDVNLAKRYWRDYKLRKRKEEW